jgi:hypothetical protein
VDAWKEGDHAVFLVDLMSHLTYRAEDNFIVGKVFYAYIKGFAATGTFNLHLVFSPI